MKTRLGQSVDGMAAAILIVAIAIMIAAYVIIIPPDARDELLGTSDTSTSTTTESGFLELLSESVGMLEPKDEMYTTHTMQTVNIYHKSEPKIIPLTNSLVVSNGWFSDSFPVLTFNVDNFEDIDKISLYFNVLSPEGTLKIYLNGNPVLEEKVMQGVKIIELPKSSLQPKDNKLEFRSSFPFWFWASNDYQLKEVGVKVNYEFVNSQEERHFAIAEDEKPNLKSARLEFYEICNLEKKGDRYSLKMYLNDKKLYDGNMMCLEGKQTFDVPLTLIQSGDNKLLFVIDNGDFTFSELKLVSSLKSSIYPTYYFTVNKNQIDDLKSGDVTSKLAFYFDDNVMLKKAKVSLNGQDFFIDTRNGNLTYDVTPYVNQGTNFIKLIPTNSFNVVGMKVYLE